MIDTDNDVVTKYSTFLDVREKPGNQIRDAAALV